MAGFVRGLSVLLVLTSPSSICQLFHGGYGLVEKEQGDIQIMLAVNTTNIAMEFH